MTGDPPLLFSRSWRQNFKDPHWGQKHSLGPLIITTGVPLFGRGALSWVQNCSAGVPRRSPLYLLFLLPASLFSSFFLLYILLFSLGRSIHKYLLLPLLVFFDSTGVYQYFRARFAKETKIHAAELKALRDSKRYSRLASRSSAFS